MSIGEDRNITVKFPEDYQADNLRGKDAVFAIHLNKITGKQLPELNDEFVKKYAGVETVADYTAKVKDRLEKQAADRGRDETENAIIEAISATAKCEIPKAMIESEIDRMVQDFSYRLMYQGLKLEDYIKYMGQTMQEFRSQFNERAEKRVLSQLIIDKIVKEEKIAAEQAEIDAKVAEQAASVNKSVEDYKKTMDRRQLEYITNDIVITKLFEFLMANNNLTK
jgi:trigger factor